MPKIIINLISKLFPKNKDWLDMTPRERAIALEVWRANRGVK